MEIFYQCKCMSLNGIPRARRIKSSGLHGLPVFQRYGKKKRKNEKRTRRRCPRLEQIQNLPRLLLKRSFKMLIFPSHFWERIFDILWEYRARRKDIVRSSNGIAVKAIATDYITHIKPKILFPHFCNADERVTTTNCKFGSGMRIYRPTPESCKIRLPVWQRSRELYFHDGG